MDHISNNPEESNAFERKVASIIQIAEKSEGLIDEIIQEIENMTTPSVHELSKFKIYLELLMENEGDIRDILCEVRSEHSFEDQISTRTLEVKSAELLQSIDNNVMLLKATRTENDKVMPSAVLAKLIEGQEYTKMRWEFLVMKLTGDDKEGQESVEDMSSTLLIDETLVDLQCEETLGEEDDVWMSSKSNVDMMAIDLLCNEKIGEKEGFGASSSQIGSYTHDWGKSLLCEETLSPDSASSSPDQDGFSTPEGLLIPHHPEQEGNIQPFNIMRAVHAKSLTSGARSKILAMLFERSSDNAEVKNQESNVSGDEQNVAGLEDEDIMLNMAFKDSLIERLDAHPDVVTNNLYKYFVMMAKKYFFNKNTVYLAMELLHKFLGKRIIGEKHVELLGAACLSISVKINHRRYVEAEVLWNNFKSLGLAGMLGSME